LQEWQCSNTELASASLGLAILAASQADSRRRAQQLIELVWTGPQPLGSQFRQTEQVILELIRSAVISIYVVSFAAYKLEGVLNALKLAARNGVLIRCVLESSDRETAGKMTMSSMNEFVTDGLAHTQVYAWPQERREHDEHGRVGKLHAKCIIVDHAQAFISSANLTEHALNLNMELGILLRGGTIPSQISDHIDLLISHGILQRVPDHPPFTR
jgi:phosphatidylserine/phosphatidylglycerophosphate/cardiolipin synthase-like enzyme